jgi:hypothetical protein
MPNENPEAGANYAVLISAVVVVFLVTSGSARMTTINARSPSLADVRAAIASAVDGDTVIVPAGRATWTSGLVITKGITLMGQTTTDSVAGTAADNTIIVDNITRAPGGVAVIKILSVSGKSYRVSGFTFQGLSTTINNNGAVVLGGNSQAVRLDHCHFQANLNQAIDVAVYDSPWGVADHNVMEFASGSQSFYFAAGTWPNPDGTHGHGYGDGSWASPTNFGSEQFFFVEDNYIANHSNFNEYGGETDGTFGARWVFRHNHCYDIEMQNHGTEGGRYRGTRATEIYNNDFHYAHSHGYGASRSGVTITHDNTFDGIQPTRGIVLNALRAVFRWPPASSPWGGASGDGPWDYNVTEPNGTHIDGHPPYLFESGTATSGSSTTLADTNKNWIPDQWVGYTAKFLGDNQVARITSNTSNTLTVLFYTDSGGGHVWQAGDQYEIHKVLVVMDQPGRGQSDLITGATPSPLAWPHNKLEPCYSWNDIYTPTNSPINFLVGGNSIGLQQSGHDYFNNTVMPGYMPYTYPHPLTTGLFPSRLIARKPTPGSQDSLHKKKHWAKKVERKKEKKAKADSANEVAKDRGNFGN